MSFLGEQERQCYENLAKEINDLTNAININSKSSNKLQGWLVIGTIVMAIAIIVGLFI